MALSVICFLWQELISWLHSGSLSKLSAQSLKERCLTHSYHPPWLLQAHEIPLKQLPALYIYINIYIYTPADCHSALENALLCMHWFKDIIELIIKFFNIKLNSSVWGALQWSYSSQCCLSWFFPQLASDFYHIMYHFFTYTRHKKGPLHLCWQGSLMMLFTHLCQTVSLMLLTAEKKRSLSLPCMKRCEGWICALIIDCAAGKLKNHILLNAGLHSNHQSRASSGCVRRILWRGIRSDNHNCLLGALNNHREGSCGARYWNSQTWMPWPGEFTV